MHCAGVWEKWTYKDRDILEAVRLVAVLRNGILVVEDERDFNHSRQAHAHERVAKHLVSHGTNGQLLRVRRHGPSRYQYDKARDKVPLGRAVALPTQPNTDQAGRPPNDAHRSVLPVVLDPGSPPPVLREGVDAAPGRNDHAVEELLRPSRPLEPQLPNQ